MYIIILMTNKNVTIIKDNNITEDVFLVFQIVDIDHTHIDNSEDGDGKDFQIRIYGKKENGSSVCLLVNEYVLKFYFKVKENWLYNITENDIENMLDRMATNIQKKNGECDGYIGVNFIDKFDFYNFNGEKKQRFGEVTFKNYMTFKKFARYLERGQKIKNKIYMFKLYESNLDPIPRFFHDRELTSVGWVKVPRSKFKYA